MGDEAIPSGPFTRPPGARGTGTLGASGPAIGGLDPTLISQVAARVANEEDFARWRNQVAQAHFCVNPVRIKGRIHEVDSASHRRSLAYDTATEPDGVILKACGTRREAICPPCAEFYRNDAFFLVASGLTGGKGVPETVTAHPACFFTTTAPSFGAVHRASTGGGVCHRRSRGESCKHGRPISCMAVHDVGDEAIGSPMCPECYEYRAQVLFNALAPELWRRTMLYGHRTLAKATGMTVTDVKDAVRLSYVKVAEFQARGTVHFHAIVRLDAAERDVLLPPPEPFDAIALARALTMAARSTWVSYPTGVGAGRIRVRWGEQVNVAIIQAGALGEPDLAGDSDVGDDTDVETSEEEGAHVPGAVASYLAKYSCKSLVTRGNLNHRVDHANLDRLGLTPHERRLVETALALAGKPTCSHLKLHLHAHQLGHSGLFLTKARGYSTTFYALRQERRVFCTQHAEKDGSAAGRRGGERPSIRHSELAFVGRGYTTAGDAWLADSLHQSRRQARTALREESVAPAGQDLP